MNDTESNHAKSNCDRTFWKDTNMQMDSLDAFSIARQSGPIIFLWTKSWLKYEWETINECQARDYLQDWMLHVGDVVLDMFGYICDGYFTGWRDKFPWFSFEIVQALRPQPQQADEVICIFGCRRCSNRHRDIMMSMHGSVGSRQWRCTSTLPQGPKCWLQMSK